MVGEQELFMQGGRKRERIIIAQSKLWSAWKQSLPQVDRAQTKHRMAIQYSHVSDDQVAGWVCLDRQVQRPDSLENPSLDAWK
jgi:hypothetical protein